MWVLWTKLYQDARSTHIKFVDVMWVLGMEVAAPAVSFMSHHCLPCHGRDKDGDADELHLDMTQCQDEGKSHCQVG